MKYQSNRYVERKFSGRQGIFEEFTQIWRRGEALETEARKLLGEGDPICENLGYSNVGMMNAYFEIEDCVKNACNNKLNPKTLGQILDVLNRIKWTGARSGRELNEAYQKAVHDVRKSQGVERNTIADACCRRLQLKRDGFLELAELWLGGDPNALKRILKNHTYWSLHNVIDDFFNEKGGFVS